MTPGIAVSAKRRLELGFTLVEMSVVLIIVALITGMAMSSGVAVLSTTRLSATTQKMAAIDQAMLSFRNANNRLPCPGPYSILAGGANYGVEAGGGMSCGTGTGAGTGVCSGNLPFAVGTCASGTALVPAVSASYVATGVNNTTSTAAEGVVPTATLGLPGDFMFDGWGNKFRYAVDISATANNYFPSMALGCVNGAITIADTSGTATPASAARSSGALYALISHGPNGHGAYANSASMKNGGSSNANELTNCHCTTGTGAISANTYAPTYVQSDPTNSSGGIASTAFDDIVTYKERWQLQNGADPTGTSCTWIGRLYITDATNHRVQVFDRSSNYLFGVGAGYQGVAGSIGSSGSVNGAFNTPNGIAFDSNGNFWVADSANNRVQEFNGSGSWLLSIGTVGSGNGQITTANAVAIDSSNNVWVADSGNFRVQEYNSSGIFLQTIGGTGSACTSCSCTSACTSHATGTGTGQFAAICGLTFDAGGNLWVADCGNNRLQQFTSGGGYMQSIPASGTAAGTGVGYFNHPVGLNVDGSGNLWVGDSNNNRYQQLTTAGVWLQSLPSSGTGGGTGSGQYTVTNQLAVDAGGMIWAIDQNNIRIENLTSSGSFILQFPCSSGACTSSATNGQFKKPSGIAVSR